MLAQWNVLNMILIELLISHWLIIKITKKLHYFSSRFKRRRCYWSWENVEIKTGNCLELKDIPPGTLRRRINSWNGAKLARSAGSSVTLSGYDGDYAILKLASGEMRKVSGSCLATVGVVSNPDQKISKLVKLKK